MDNDYIEVIDCTGKFSEMLLSINSFLNLPNKLFKTWQESPIIIDGNEYIIYDKNINDYVFDNNLNVVKIKLPSIEMAR